MSAPKIAERDHHPKYPLSKVTEHPRNPNQGDVGALAELIRRHGFRGAIEVQKSTGYVIAGNHRVKAARALGMTHVPADVVDVDDREAVERLLADNRSRDLAAYDDQALAELLAELAQDGTGQALAGTGFDGDDLDRLLADLAHPLQVSGLPDGPSPLLPKSGVRLADSWVFPPFSVLDARSGPWQDRKRAWLDLGIRSEIGRSAVTDAGGGAEYRAAGPHPGGGGAWLGRDASGTTPHDGKWKKGGLTIGSASGAVPDYYAQKRKAEAGVGRQLSNAEFEADYLAVSDASGLGSSGTSVFDPVLAELAYRWWCPPGGRILDPFAGGSVRGIVAGRLGRWYVGIDLSQEQAAANDDQVGIVGDGPAPVWVVGDSRVVLDRDDTLGTAPYDFVFSCPPYADLERYSDDPSDLSAMSWPDFCAAYREIIAGACARLADDRFACFVVGEVRGPDGTYRGLVPETIAAFEAAGLSFYNEAILVKPVGSLPVRVGRQFTVGRKLGKAHQNVLVFVKGDGKRASARIGAPEGADLSAFAPDASNEDPAPTP